MRWQTTRLPVAPDVVAPDGCDVRVLLGARGGSLAHFELGAGATSVAVVHRTVEEIWFVLDGRGELWRAAAGEEEVVTLAPGVCLTIPVGTRFQFRADAGEPLRVLGVTLPPWPGAGEAVALEGRWPPSVAPGPA